MLTRMHARETNASLACMSFLLLRQLATEDSGHGVPCGYAAAVCERAYAADFLFEEIIMARRVLGRRLQSGVLGLALGAAMALIATPAHAQLNWLRGMEVRPAMTSRDLDRYARTFQLNEAQAEAAKELLASYTTDYQQMSKERRDRLKEINDEFQETRDFEVMEQMGPAMEKFGKSAEELEKTLLADFRVLLTEDQDALWPKFERTRRREKTIDKGTLSGESVDLVVIVDDLKLSDESRKGLADSLEQYESDLDRVLAERNKVTSEQDDLMPKPGRGGGISIDFTAIEEATKKIQEAGSKVRDVNQRYARNIEGLLPEAELARFQAAVKRQSFPQVYRPSRAAKALEAAEKLADLDARQKESVVALREQYERDLATTNEKWAAAVVDEEKSGGGTKGFGGIMFSMGDEEKDTPVSQARKAKRELDKKALDSLKSLISDAQFEKLPKRDEASESGPGGGGAIIRTIGGPAR